MARRRPNRRLTGYPRPECATKVRQVVCYPGIRDVASRSRDPAAQGGLAFSHCVPPFPTAIFRGAMSRIAPAFIATALLALALPGRAHDHSPAGDMADAARAFLNALSEDQRKTATFEFQSPERVNWHFIPRDRKGLAWKDMSAAQRHLATALLASGLSHRGMVKATTIMSLEQVLLELEQGRGPKRDPEAYYWTVFGKPDAQGAWGWRVEGHHLSLNFTVADGKVASATPSFLGSNPGEVRQGPRAGLRALGAEEDLGRALLRSLDDSQRSVAVLAAVAPADILTGASRKADPLSPAGLSVAGMTDSQRQQLRRLVEEYLRRARPEVADADLAEIEKAGWEKVTFAWAGPAEPGKGHYYRVQGPTFLLEYDNTQNDANHIHAVWREFHGDFGDDVLARHYRETPH